MQFALLNEAKGDRAFLGWNIFPGTRKTQRCLCKSVFMCTIGTLKHNLINGDPVAVGGGTVRHVCATVRFDITPMGVTHSNIAS